MDEKVYTGSLGKVVVIYGEMAGEAGQGADWVPFTGKTVTLRFLKPAPWKGLHQMLRGGRGHKQSPEPQANGTTIMFRKH